MKTMATINASVSREQLRERLAAAVQTSEKPLIEISRISGVSLRDIYRYIKDGSEPSLLRFVALVEACEASVDAVIYGDDGTEIGDIADIGDAGVIRVPILGIVAAAGAGAWNDRAPRIGALPFASGYLRRLGVSLETAHCIRASGDSMEPTINSGSLVMVDAARRQVGDGGVYAIVIDDQARLKRLQLLSDGSLMLISDNRDVYPPERVDRTDRDRIEIIGRVVWTERVL